MQAIEVEDVAEDGGAFGVGEGEERHVGEGHLRQAGHDATVVSVQIATVQGNFLGEDALEKVEVAALHVRLAIGADTEVDGQAEEEREVEVGDAGIGRFEVTDGVEEEVEERRIGLLLADDPIENL